MRRHYLDAEEIAALLDTSGRRGEPEEAPAPWWVGGSTRRLGLTRKTSISSKWPDISLQKYDPSIRFSLLFSHHREHVGVVFLSVLSSKSQQKQKVEHCFLVPPKTITILWFLTWRVPLNGCALCSLDLGFYRTFSDRFATSLILQLQLEHLCCHKGYVSPLLEHIENMLSHLCDNGPYLHMIIN